MTEVFGYIALGFMLLVIAFIWYCILSPDEMSEDTKAYMEELEKKQLRDAGWTEEEIEKLDWSWKNYR